MGQYASECIKMYAEWIVRKFCEQNCQKVVFITFELAKINELHLPLCDGKTCATQMFHNVHCAMGAMQVLETLKWYKSFWHLVKHLWSKCLNHKGNPHILRLLAIWHTLKFIWMCFSRVLDDSVCNSACQSLSHCVFNHPTLHRHTHTQISDSTPTWYVLYQGRGIALCTIFTILQTLWNSEQKNAMLIKLFCFSSNLDETWWNISTHEEQPLRQVSSKSEEK